MLLEKLKTSYQKKSVTAFNVGNGNKPFLSVCVVTYHQVKYISECLKSILNQKTNFQFEILIGDDASTDGTTEICKEFAKKYPDQIRLFLHHRENNITINGSPSGRFNFLYNLAQAKGKYIAICDGDDYWTDVNKLQKQVNLLEAEEQYSFCFHQVDKIDESGQIVESNISPANFFNPVMEFSSKHLLAYGMFANPCSLVFRNCPEVILALIEAPLWPFADKTLEKLLALKGKGYLFKESMACYRHVQSSVSHSKQWKEIKIKQHYKYHIELYQYIRSLVKDESQLLVIKEVIKRYNFCLKTSHIFLHFSVYAIKLNYICAGGNLKKFMRYYGKEVYGVMVHEIMILVRYIKVKLSFS